MPATDKKTALEDLFIRYLKETEIEWLLNLVPGGDRVLAEIPNFRLLSKQDLSRQVILQLARKPSLQRPFFEKLSEQHSEMKAAVTRIASLWLGPRESRNAEIDGRISPSTELDIKLFQFFTSEFSQSTLHRFISQGENGIELLAAMSSPNSPKVEHLAEQYLLQLKASCGFDEKFFARLLRQRPKAESRIQWIARAFGVELCGGVHRKYDDTSHDHGDALDTLRKLLVVELTAVSAETRIALALALGTELKVRARVSAESLAGIFSECDLLRALKAINNVDLDHGGLKGLMCIVLPYCFRPEAGRPLPGHPGILEVPVATATMLEVARAYADRRACAFDIGGDDDIPQIRSKYELGPLPDLGPDPDGTKSAEVIEEHLATRFKVDRSHLLWREELRGRLKWFVDPNNRDRRSAFYVVEAPTQSCGWLVAVPQLRSHYPALHFLMLSTDDIERFRYETSLKGPLGAMLVRYKNK